MKAEDEVRLMTVEDTSSGMMQCSVGVQLEKDALSIKINSISKGIDEISINDQNSVATIETKDKNKKPLERVWVLGAHVSPQTSSMQQHGRDCNVGDEFVNAVEIDLVKSSGCTRRLGMEIQSEMANKSVVDEMEQEVTNGSHNGPPCNGQAQDQAFTAKEIQAPTELKSSVSRRKKMK